MHLASEISDADAVLSALRHNAKWLVELSVNQPGSFIGREDELYSAMASLRLVMKRLPRATGDFDRVLRLVECEMAVEHAP